MEQTVIKIGNSLGIIIPQPLAKELKLKLGSKVFVDKDVQTETMTVSKQNNITRPTITPEFYAWLKKFNAKYKAALTELAKK